MEEKKSILPMNVISQRISDIKAYIEKLNTNNILSFKERTELEQKISHILPDVSTPLHIAVIGSINSGKSSLINALIEDEILPEHVLPCTGTICYIQYGSHLSIKKQQTNEEGTIIDTLEFSQLREFIDKTHTSFTPSKLEQGYINIFHNNKLCQENITLIDTPGINDLSTLNKLTHDILDNIDAVIYCINAIQGYTYIDNTCIESLKAKNIDNIFFVIGYMDILNTENEVENFKNTMIQLLSTKTSLKEQGIFFVSAMDELNKIFQRDNIMQENGINKLRGSILKYVHQNYLQIKILRCYNKIEEIQKTIAQDTTKTLNYIKQQAIQKEQQSQMYSANAKHINECRLLLQEKYDKCKADIIFFTREKLSAEICYINDNLESWFDDFFKDNQSHPFMFWTKSHKISKQQISQIEEKCTSQILNTVQTCIFPFIYTTVNNFTNEINQILSYNINLINMNHKLNSKIITPTSPILQLDIDYKYDIATLRLKIPLPTLTSVITGAAIATGTAFIPILTGAAALLSSIQKNSIITQIKKQLSSSETLNQLTQFIIETVNIEKEIIPILKELSMIESSYKDQEKQELREVNEMHKSIQSLRS